MKKVLSTFLTSIFLMANFAFAEDTKQSEIRMDNDPNSTTVTYTTSEDPSIRKGTVITNNENSESQDLKVEKGAVDEDKRKE